MRIYLLNLRRAIKTFERVAVLTLAVLFTFGVLYLVDGYVVSYAEAGITADDKPIIIIDAGHGGEDSGAVGANGTLEKELNLDVAFEMKKALEDKGYTVVMTRTDDKLLYTESENIKGIRKLSDLNLWSSSRLSETAVLNHNQLKKFPPIPEHFRR